MCGKLQCENVDTMPVFGIEPAVIKSTIRGTVCWGVDFQLGTDVPDPAMVNEGTKCDNGKVSSGPTSAHYVFIEFSISNL